jgi:hypothetical protein
MKHKIILLVLLLLLGFGHSNAQYGPVVSFSYDDGYPTWWDPGLIAFQEYGFPGVGFINATRFEYPGAIDDLRELQAAGWEISNHTYDHSGITESTVSSMKNWLDSYGFYNSGFHGPTNDWTHSLVNIVKKYSPYYSATYNQDQGMPQPFDLYHLERFSLTNDVPIATVRAKLDDAVANNKWIIFYGHVIAGTLGDGSGWNQAEELLRLTFDAVVERKIPVKTVREVIYDHFPPGCVIECSVDTMQDPVLTYFEEGGGSFSTSVWNEYWHSNDGQAPYIIGSPAVYCHTSNDTLPIMKFSRNVPNGVYEVKASILPYNTGRTYRLFYSLNDEGNPSKDSVEVNKNSDVSLGTVTITDGQFALYTQKADAVSGGDGYVGWAFIKLFTQVSTNVKVFIQGSYTSGGTMTTSLNSSGFMPFPQPYIVAPWNYTGSERVYNMPTDIVDWVLVELRTGTEANTTVGRRAAFLKSDGSIVDLDGLSQVKFNRIVPGNYYIVIRHRNHLPIMSANPVNLSFTNSSLHDFSTAQTQAYGSEPMVDLGGGLYGMYAGDGNGDGGINIVDRNLVWRLQNGTIGYLPGDFDLNSGVNIIDRNLKWRVNNGKLSQVPN